MARKRTTKKSAGGRGSPEAIQKRRTARQLNTLLTGGSKMADKLDGRTEKRRKRLIKELKDGRSGRPLKPIDVVSHVNELLDIGESLASIKKQGVKPRKTDLNDEVLEVARKTQAAYGFRPEAWSMLGIDIQGGAKAGGARKKPGKRRAKKR